MARTAVRQSRFIQKIDALILQNPTNAHAHQTRPRTPMLKLMSKSNKAILFDDVRAQAQLRARLGVPVCLLMLLCIWYWGPSSPAIGAWQVISAFSIHMLYNIVLSYRMRTPSRLRPALIANITAIVDPLLLSVGLALMGQIGQLFACFYLFTILGFGFRINAQTMTLCQLASIAGFTGVALLSPPWKAHPVNALSVLLFLAVVPLYARALIAKLQLACEHAESESRAKTQLLANVSHELRTPLTGIVSSAQLMIEENTDQQVQKRSDTILKLSRDLMTQIDDLLDSAKYGADALQLENRPFRLADIAEQVRRSLGATALSKGIMLQVSTDERISPVLMGDDFHLGRVMLNLAGNAVKFTDHGEVLVRMGLLEESADACRVLFSCRDTGIGIAPDMHQKIFEPFFQASAGTTRKYGGTGLGMSIAQGILAGMGGALRLRSAPGQGSLFEFDLWLQKAPALTPDAVRTHEIVRNKRILLADDNATNLLLTRELLERDGHHVLTADNGPAAVRLLETAEVDLAILDFNMGELDGASVLQIYRFGSLNPAPAYILTADNAPATTRRLMESGAAGVLHKPVALATLRQAISHLFSAGPALATDTVAASPCIDKSTIADLKSLSSDTTFFEQVMHTAAADIDTLCSVLSAAIRNRDLTVTCAKAHALKGLSVAVGAVQLSSIATRLIHIAQVDLDREGAALVAEIGVVSKRSISALRSLA